MKDIKAKEKRTMSYRTKWIITAITLFVAVVLVAVCISQGMFSFEPGSVKANDQDEAVATEKVDDGDADEPKESSYTVFVTAGNGGSANPSGKVSVEAWGSTTINFTPEEDYKISSVVVDGADVGPVSSYTLSYITSDHTIMVTFDKIPKPTPEPTPTPEADDGGDTDE